MIAVALWQSLLNGLGWFMAQVYNLVPNYALTIIIVTAIIRILLLPFGFKQIKSMQHMQALQPKIAEIKRRYKNDKAKQQEEQTKLMREAGVNPLGGCLPMLLTLPFLFAMYAVIRPPQLAAYSTDSVQITAASIVAGNTAEFTLSQGASLAAGDSVVVTGVTPGEYNGQWTVSSATPGKFQADIGGTADPATAFGEAGNVDSYEVHNNHLPTDSTLFYNVVMHQNLDALGLNLQCSLAQSGTQVVEKDTGKQPLTEGLPILSSSGEAITAFDPAPTAQASLNCGSKKFPDAIPYVVLLLAMLGTAIYQQRQMSKASPPNAQTGTQAAMMKYMPLLYGVWGWAFPAGLIIYWTTANGIQIVQQTLMLRAGHIGPEALERRMAEQRARAESGKGQRKGIMGYLNEKASQAQAQQETVKKQRPPANNRSNSRSKQKPGQKPRQKPGQKAAGKGGGPSNSSKSTAKGGPNTGGTKGQTPPPKGGAKPGNQLKPKKPEGSS
jgi:YidC/Oxa1 family membrane protein insertase